MKSYNWNPHHNLTKPMGEANIYIRFVYVSQTICNHTQGQCLGSVNDYPVTEVTCLSDNNLS